MSLKILIIIAWPHYFTKNLRGEIWADKTSLTLPHFIEVPVPSQESEQSYICVLGVSIFPLSTILIFDFGIVPKVWYFMFFTLLLRIALYPMENVLKKFFLRRYKLDWKYAIMIIWMIFCIIYTYCMSGLEIQVATTAGNNQKYSFSEIPEPFKTEFVWNASCMVTYKS